MSAARPASVSSALPSPATLTACPPAGVRLAWAPAGPRSSVPAFTARVTLTGRSKAADSASATTKTPPTRLRASSAVAAAAGAVSVAVSFTPEARNSTDAALTLGWPAGTAAPLVQSKAVAGTAPGLPVLLAGWFQAPPLAPRPLPGRAPALSRSRSSAMTCKVQLASRSCAKVTSRPARAAFTCARLPWNWRMSFRPLRVTVQSPPVSAGSA